MQRWDLEYRGNPYSEHREMVPSDEYGEWVTFDDADAEIRRLRAMVLRGYARAFRNTASCACDPPEDKAPYDETMRSARLLEHWASAIEAGRL